MLPRLPVARTVAPAVRLAAAGALVVLASVSAPRSTEGEGAQLAAAAAARFRRVERRTVAAVCGAEPGCSTAVVGAILGVSRSSHVRGISPPRSKVGRGMESDGLLSAGRVGAAPASPLMAANGRLVPDKLAPSPLDDSDSSEPDMEAEEAREDTDAGGAAEAATPTVATPARVLSDAAAVPSVALPAAVAAALKTGRTVVTRPSDPRPAARVPPPAASAPNEASARGGAAAADDCGGPAMAVKLILGAGAAGAAGSRSCGSCGPPTPAALPCDDATVVPAGAVASPPKDMTAGAAGGCGWTLSLAPARGREKR